MYILIILYIQKRKQTHTPLSHLISPSLLTPLGFNTLFIFARDVTNIMFFSCLEPGVPGVLFTC